MGLGSTPRVDAPTDVVVLAGGDAVTRDLVPQLPGSPTVIAADGGLAWASILGLHVDVVVGDMDSVDAADLSRARAAGAEVETHPVDKDRTDLAIALDSALRHAPARVTVVGGHGGRLDHHLANLLLLASPAYAAMEIVAHMGTAMVTVIRDAAIVPGHPGETLSLLPLHGPALGVTTDGLRFPLDGEDLAAGSSRGVSNVFTADRATVRLDAGVLVAIRPGQPPETR